MASLVLKKQSGARAGSPPSLANLLEESYPKPCFRRTKPKGSVANIMIVCATFTRQLLSLHKCWSEKNKAFIMIWSSLNRFVKQVTWVKNEVSWGDLPLELLGEIGKRMQSRLDILRFRSVCKQWRTCLPYPTRLPLLVPGVPPNRALTCAITEVSFYKCGGEEGFLVCEEVDHDGGKFYTLFNGYRIRKSSEMVRFESRNLSFTKTKTSWYGKVNPWSQLSFVGKAYHLRCSHFYLNLNFEKKLKVQFNKSVKKMVIISSNGDDGVNPSYALASHLTAVAHVEGGRLALLRLGGSPLVWEAEFCTRVFEDIATYRGRLCTLEPSSGRVFVMDYDSLEMTQLSPPCPRIVSRMRNKNLFEYLGNLYLADEHCMYKLTVSLQQWIEVVDDLFPLRGLVPFFIRHGI